MNDMTESKFEPKDLFRIFTQHRKKMILFACVAMGVALAWVMFGPRTYESVAKLYVRLGREQVSLDPTATIGPTMNLYQTHENEINSTLQILDNRHIAELVVDAIGAENILADRDHRDDSSSAASTSGTAADGLWSAAKTVLRVEPESDRSRAIRNLQERVSIWAPANSGVVVVRARSGDPKMAQRIVQQWTDIFLSEYVRLTHTEGTFKFFKRQADALAPQLATSEQELQRAKDAAGLVSVTGQQAMLENRIGTLRLQAATNQAELASAQANLRQLTAEIKSVPPQIIAQQLTGVANDAYDRMRERLYELEMKEQELKSRYTPQHPSVAAVIKQRAEAKAILDGQSTTRAHSAAEPNPIHQTLSQSLLTEQARVAALAAEGRALEGQIELANRDLQALNANELKIAKLTRQRDILQDNYRSHMSKLEQARTNEALGRDHISSVNVLQPAFLNERPISPSRAMTLALGFLIAIGGSMGLAMLAEYRNPTFSAAGHARTAMDRPVTVTIPRTPPLEVYAR
ncbi:MAG: GumC family protein [Planctomycetes bacterium]|nr:GumC family protein [Planctomycetota bacterium]